ncbi:malate dehydrogenase family protein [Trichomonas vaginalis G3]|uniref:malate dehydrogenase n=1 Tax=Trichomonas vaginalis (strain ATCC PRA-98 / G3) TaxID=412133 RepID=A2DUI4_TRIV3|nr:malate dehydrogenase [Trichomonas vaginalis G3]EAY15875.1 malate dehydrogenase family protein [Trichomonas vaginalis G3]KAI5506666.1 MDH domain-containing protein [Trichomonas vaginalis G3]|eukprot:XP_001328098.1 malate dehydrogenase [Trichomonas vaginalis G3]
MEKPAHVLIVGASGQIGYILAHWIAHGDLYGDRQVFLHLYSRTQDKLTALVMELEDCAFPHLSGCVASTDPAVAFKDVECAFLTSSYKLPAWEVRSFLVNKNSHIYKEVGEWLSMYANPSCKVLMIANPTNTNAALCAKFAKNLNPQNFTSLSMLDHNRANFYIADKLGVPVCDLKDVIVWGNHGETIVPDLTNATFVKNGKTERILDVLGEDFMKNEFYKFMTSRGPCITKHRGISAAASTVVAVLEHMKALLFGTKKILSLAIPVPENNKYGIKPGIVFSFPCTNDEDGKVNIVDYPVNDWLQEKLKVTEKDLVDELKFALETLQEQ